MKRKSLAGSSIATIIVTLGAATLTLISPLTATAISDYSRNGDANIDFDHTIKLDMSCSNSSTNIKLTAGLSNGRGNGTAVSVAFTSPSVGVNQNGEWIYTVDNRKVMAGSSDLSINSVQYGINGVSKQGNTGVGGNPFIYYLDKDGKWQELGRCVDASSQASVSERALNFAFNVHGNSESHVGSCVTNSKTSGVKGWGRFNPDLGSNSDKKELIYSNKRLNGTGTDTLKAGSESIPAVTYIYNKNGYKVLGDEVTADISLSDIVASLGITSFNGIGGNPKVWLKSGSKESAWTIENYLGRCNQLI